MSRVLGSGAIPTLLAVFVPLLEIPARDFRVIVRVSLSSRRPSTSLSSIPSIRAMTQDLTIVSIVRLLDLAALPVASW
jgi:hypothetical protein